MFSETNTRETCTNNVFLNDHTPSLLLLKFKLVCAASQFCLRVFINKTIDEQVVCSPPTDIYTSVRAFLRLLTAKRKLRPYN